MEQVETYTEDYSKKFYEDLEILRENIRPHVKAFGRKYPTTSITIENIASREPTVNTTTRS